MDGKDINDDVSDDKEVTLTNEENIDVSKWLNRISKAREKEKNWRDRAKRCINIYRDDDVVCASNFTTQGSSDNDSESSFNILWANVETLLPALFSAVPKPDIRNRYLTQDKVAEAAGQIIERTLTYSLDLYNFARLMKAAIKDYLLTGRCVMRVRLIEEFDYETAPALNVDDVAPPQAVRCELVHWDSFVIDPVKRWEDVSWIAFIHMLSKKEFNQYFPEAASLSITKETDKSTGESRYKVYEVWDKVEKKVYFLGQGEKPLKVMDDPFKLQHFWPIPEPLYSIQTNDSLIPIPEFTIYQAQAYELNQVCYRITDLVRSCKFIGIYDSQQTGLGDLLTSRDSQLSPVTSNVLRQGGVASVIDILDTSPISKILAQLYQQRDQIKSIIYEVTGISDIIRGESKASETATAQNIKARYAGLRLRDRRDNINRFIVDLLRIKSELISTFFSTQQLSQMSGIQITPDIEHLIRDDVLQSYKIDIESDSTILADMEEETGKRAQLVASITQFLSTVSPLVAKGALPIETAKALLMFALQSTKITRELQDALELIGSPQSQSQQPQMPRLPQGMPGLPQQMMSDPQQLPPNLQGQMQMPPGLQEQNPAP